MKFKRLKGKCFLGYDNQMYSKWTNQQLVLKNNDYFTSP